LTLLDGLQDDHLVCKNYIKRCYTEIVQMICSVCHPCNLQHLLLHENPGWFGYWVTRLVLETGHWTSASVVLVKTIIISTKWSFYTSDLILVNEITLEWFMKEAVSMHCRTDCWQHRI